MYKGQDWYSTLFAVSIDHVISLRNKRKRIPKGQSRETGNIGYTRRRKNTTQYVLDTTTSKQHK